MTMLIFVATNSVQGFCFLHILASSCYLLDSHVDEVRGHIHLSCLLLGVFNVGEWRKLFLYLSLSVGQDEVCSMLQRLYSCFEMRRVSTVPLCAPSLPSYTTHSLLSNHLGDWLCSHKTWGEVSLESTEIRLSLDSNTASVTKSPDFSIFLPPLFQKI